jgi:beta-carotene 15,15'-dioxygenase
MTYSNTSHGYWLLGITIFLVFIKNLIVTIPETYINLVCLFLILTIGISHGSLDNLKGNKILILYKIKNKFIFYLAYVIVAAFFTFLWLLSPSFTLLIFLVVASYHFGKEDCTYIEWSDILYKESIEFNNKRIEQVYYFLKGSIVIWAPLTFHFTETLNIFEILFIDNITFKNILLYCNDNHIFLIAFCISVLIGFAGFFVETICIIVLNLYLSPLFAFTVYFCFLHSLRHSVSLIKEIEIDIMKKKSKRRFNTKFVDISIDGIKIFLKKALPLTLITAIFFLASVYTLTNYYILDDAILKVIFIGLASLTFPHILLEYLIEKNEK